MAVRHVPIYNRTDETVHFSLSAPNFGGDLAAAPNRRQAVAAASTFVWGLKAREDLELVATQPGRAPAVVPLPLSKPGALALIVDAGGVRLIDEAGRKGPLEPDGIRRVQVGCGPHNIFPDWWNVDIRPFRGVDDILDVTKDWPYRNLDAVYGEHFLEHLPLDGAMDFLVFAGRSLRPGGIVRLTTPNLEWVLRSHYPLQGDPGEKQLLQATMSINRAFHGWGHKFLYSPTFMETLCRRVGYADVRFYDYGVSETPSLVNLERHGGFRYEHGVPNTLIIEAEIGDPEAMTDAFRPYLQKHFLNYYYGGH